MVRIVVTNDSAKIRMKGSPTEVIAETIYSMHEVYKRLSYRDKLAFKNVLTENYDLIFPCVKEEKV